MPPAPKQKDFGHTGDFDRAAFLKAYTQEFKQVPKFNLASLSDLMFVLGKIGADPRISDLRWSAYMLATVFIESSHTVKTHKQTIDKKGRLKVHTVKLWRNFAPIEEAGHGKGLKYYTPVKVKRLSNGDAQITEYDGDQWVISAGTAEPRDLHRHQTRGTPADAKPSNVYENDEGEPNHYFGRGYVQLTWWSNYAKAGVALGRGLNLLFDPEKVNDPDTAYQILATGMCTGGIYANGRRLSQFFHGNHTDYVGARDMVNPGAKHANKQEVASIAERFQAVLETSRISHSVAAR